MAGSSVAFAGGYFAVLLSSKNTNSQVPSTVPAYPLSGTKYLTIFPIIQIFNIFLWI